MSGGNFFFEAGKALVLALDKHERDTDPSKLLDGGEGEVMRRWACSAVKLHADAGWLVVPKADPVQVGQRRVRAYEGGKFSGRTKYYGQDWLLANAAARGAGLAGAE